MTFLLFNSLKDNFLVNKNNNNTLHCSTTVKQKQNQDPNNHTPPLKNKPEKQQCTAKGKCIIAETQTLSLG